MISLLKIFDIPLKLFPIISTRSYVSTHANINLLHFARINNFTITFNIIHQILFSSKRLILIQPNFKSARITNSKYSHDTRAINSSLTFIIRFIHLQKQFHVFSQTCQFIEALLSLPKIISDHVRTYKNNFRSGA